MKGKTRGQRARQAKRNRAVRTRIAYLGGALVVAVLLAVGIGLMLSSSSEERAAQKQPAGNPEYVWAFDSNQEVSTSLQVRRLDTTIILNRDGEVAFRDGRPTDYSTLVVVLEEAGA